MMRQAGKAGYCAMYSSKLGGGRGLKYVEVAALFEVFGATDAGIAINLALQNTVAYIMDK